MTTSLAGILVTDLVGSTSLRARLGDQRAEGLRRAHQRLLRAIVSRHRGRVVQWLGDGILAAFPSASAAANAAIGIQQALDRENRRPRRVAELAVRIGLGAGDVSWSERGCEGRAEREARMLCGAASGGEIRAPEDAIELIGSRETLRTRAVRPGVLAIDWQPIRKATFRLDLAPALRVSERMRFVGRAPHRERLRAALRRAISGEPQLVVIRGEAGIGKTRLSAEFVREAIDQGAVVMFGPSHEDLGIPYEPIARALRSWMESVEDLSVRLGARGGELARLVPEIAEWAPDLPPPTPSDPETEQLCMYDAVGEWLSTAALDDPVVLVLDSLHCAANPTYELLRHALRMLADSRIVIVTTQRPGDPRTAALQQWALEWLGPDSVSEVELLGLSPDEVAQLVDPHAQPRQAQALAGAIHLVTGGNPLHIGELLRRDAAGILDAHLPATVHAALRANLDRLDAPLRLALETASVLGEEFDGALLAELLGDPDRTYAALEHAERAGLLREVDRRALRYAFSHALMRTTLYESIGAGRVARMHERAALALESRSDGASDALVPELARHYCAAAALGHRDRAAHYAAQAAQRALRQYANDQAAELFAEAMRLLSSTADPALRCDLMTGRGEALRRMGDPQHRGLLFEAADLALAHSDGDRAGRALLATYRGTFSHALHVDYENVDRLRATLARIDPESKPLRARLLALLAVELAWAVDRSESQVISDEAVAVARDTRDRALLAEVLAHRQWTVFHPIEDRLQTAAELSELALTSPDPLMRFESAGTEVFTAIRCGIRGDLERAIATQRLLAAEIDQPLVRWMLLINEATVALLEGRFADMRRTIEAGRDLGRSMGQPDVDAQYAAHRFWLDVEVMPPDRARAGIERIARSYRSLAPHNLGAVALRCCELGLADLAEPMARELVSAVAEPLVDQLALSRTCQIAELAMRLGDAPLGERVLSRLLPHAGEHANMLFATMGSVARYLGLACSLLGRLDEAEYWLLAAEEANAKLGAVTWLARTRLDLAELRFERVGSADPRGRGSLTQAVSAATELGLPTLLERAGRIRAL